MGSVTTGTGVLVGGGVAALGDGDPLVEGGVGDGSAASGVSPGSPLGAASSLDVERPQPPQSDAHRRTTARRSAIRLLRMVPRLHPSKPIQQTPRFPLWLTRELCYCPMP